MIKVKVKFLQRAGDLVPPDKRVVFIELRDNASIEELLNTIKNSISRRLGEGVLSGRLIITILVNGTPVKGFKHRLRNGDSVTFLTPEMGG